MSAAGLWVVILGGMAVTYATRLAFIVFIPPGRLPLLLQRGLRLVPSAVLAALIAPEILRPEGTFQLGPGNPQLIASAVAVLVSWRTRNTWLTIGAGLAAFWLLLSIG